MPAETPYTVRFNPILDDLGSCNTKSILINWLIDEYFIFQSKYIEQLYMLISLQ